MIPALFDHLWQSTLFACGAGLLVLALRRHSARARYWKWFAASVKFLIPFSLLESAGSWLAPRAESAVLSQPVAPAVTWISTPFVAAMAPAAATAVATTATTTAAPAATTPRLGGGVATKRQQRATNRWARTDSSPDGCFLGISSVASAP